jgi:hypothetical protein
MNLLNYPFEKVEYPFNFLVRGDTIYNKKPLFELLQYTMKDHIYVYEDSLFVLYDPTEPTPRSHSFVRLKKMFSISPSMFLNENIDNVQKKIDYLHFRLYSKNKEYYFDGFIFSKHFLDEKKFKVKEVHNNIVFIERYGILIKDINSVSVLELNKELSSIDYNILQTHLLRQSNE